MSYQEAGPGEESRTIITYDYGWGIYPIGKTEPIGFVSHQTFDHGETLIYGLYDEKNWPIVDSTVQAILNDIEILGFEVITPNSILTVDFPELSFEIIQSMGLTNGSPAPPKKEQGPNLRTQERYKVFSKLKKEHPTWSQARVAQEASDQLGEHVTSDTVRNTYRLMGEKWERGDRVR